jgi:hypothetical protein
MAASLPWHLHLLRPEFHVLQPIYHLRQESWEWLHHLHLDKCTISWDKFVFKNKTDLLFYSY